MENTEKPMFKHDCDKCAYLGSLPHGDMYACKDTVIFRYGSDGPDYLSGIDFVPSIPELRKAYEIAVNKGML